MKDIDLTKCVNVRAKVTAKTFGKKEEFTAIGMIDKDGDEDFLLHTDDNHYIDLFSDGKMDEDIIDLEIVPRDPGTYRDWQVGDSLKCVDLEREVIFRSGKLVVISDPAKDSAEGVWTCNELFRSGYRLVLTDIERQIIEETKKYEPQDGDIVAWKDKEGEGRPAISIYREKDWSYMTLFTTGICCVNEVKLSMKIVRPATDEEKQKLFDAIAKEGKRWNAEKKMVEDIPKPYEFKKGEPVLVRGYEFHRWIIAAYVDKDKLGFIANAGVSVIHWKYCITYNERTMHLLGTNEDYKEGE